MSQQGGMQLTPAYKTKLDPKFLAWYHDKFTSDRMIFAHWSVTGRCHPDAAYHREVQEDDNGRVFTANPANVKFSEDLHEHTYGRNTNSIAICIASMAGGDTNDLGPNAPTPEQIREFVRCFAVACIDQRIPVANIMSHAEAADNVDGFDGYAPYGPLHGCERWDWQVWLNPRTLALKPAFADRPSGWEFFPDWLRCQVVLKIQEFTKAKWH